MAEPISGKVTSAAEPHPYVGWPSPSRWRTCQVCGRGANAGIHKPTQEQVDAISGSAYGFTKAEVDAIARQSPGRADG